MIKIHSKLWGKALAHWKISGVLLLGVEARFDCSHALICVSPKRRKDYLQDAVLVVKMDFVPNQFTVAISPEIARNFLFLALTKMELSLSLPPFCLKQRSPTFLALWTGDGGRGWFHTRPCRLCIWSFLRSHARPLLAQLGS